MLIATVFALALVVAPVMLLALTRAVWVLVIAVGSIFVALAVLAGAFGAAVADGDEPAPRRTARTPDERKRVTPFTGRERAAQPDRRDRSAA
jgi:hypothetical protein